LVEIQNRYQEMLLKQVCITDMKKHILLC